MEFGRVYEGICHVFNKGYRKVELHIDYKDVCVALTTKNYKMRVGWGSIHRIKSLINQDWKALISHIYRESIKCVDTLARLRVRHGEKIQYYNVCLQDLSSTFLADMVGICYCRIVRM